MTASLAGSIAVAAGWLLLRRSRTRPGAPATPSGSREHAPTPEARLAPITGVDPTVGPKIVAIGGGSGLSNTLRALKPYTADLTAIVTVADDGGSSGRLRRDLGVIPPGDIRNCIVALADVEPLMTQLFQYRFDEGEIAGHSFGNLFLAAMSGVTGSMEDAIRETSRVLSVHGEILPSSLADVVLHARMRDGREVRGESAIPLARGDIQELHIEPRHPPVNPEAVRALAEAELVVLGPGSLFTSLLPNLLVPGLLEALEASPALKVFVCNVATQHGETDRLDAAGHVAAIRAHTGSRSIFHIVLANSEVSDPAPFPPEWHAEPVIADPAADFGGAELALCDLVEDDNRYKHDEAKLASALLQLLHLHAARSVGSSGTRGARHLDESGALNASTAGRNGA